MKIRRKPDLCRQVEIVPVGLSEILAPASFGCLYARFITCPEFHVDVADLLFAVNIILIHLGKPGHASVTGSVDIAYGFGNYLLTFFFRCVFYKYRVHMHYFMDQMERWDRLDPWDRWEQSNEFPIPTAQSNNNIHHFSHRSDIRLRYMFP